MWRGHPRAPSRLSAPYGRRFTAAKCASPLAAVFAARDPGSRPRSGLRLPPGFGRRLRGNLGSGEDLLIAGYRPLLRPPVLDHDAVAALGAISANGDHLEAIRPALETAHHLRRDAHRVPRLELDDLVVELQAA